MPAAIRRLFGIKDDASAGGSEYDTLTMGLVPDVDTFWPVTGGNIDKNVERTDRNDEVRQRRAAVAPRPFRAGPVMTVPVPAYRSVVEKALKKTLGGADTMTGTVPASVTHTLAALGYGATQLPAVHAQMVRDDNNHKMSGGAFQRTTLNFPLDGEGTCECEIWGKYHAHFATAPPTATYTNVNDVLMLRDAQMFVDGSMTAIPDLAGFTFAFVNNLAKHWYPKRNIVTQTIGTPTQTRKLWFPAEHKLGAAQDVTFTIMFGNTNTAQELAQEYGQVEKFVFEVTGGPLGTTPPAVELLRITVFGGVLTGGGAEALSARDDITASFDGGAFYSDTDAADIKIEVVNSSAVAIT